MATTNPVSLSDIEQLLATTTKFTFNATDKVATYMWLEITLYRFRYRHCSRSHKGLVQQYLRKVTGYSKQSVKRLVGQWLKVGRLRWKKYRRHTFPVTYTSDDVELLAVVDQAHQTLSGPATKIILKREFETFRKTEYERLANISPSHLYTLRQRSGYRSTVSHYEKTKPTKIPIGERRQPVTNGEPGFIRVDSVHQGDDPVTGKGVYHVNFVDEVTQWELVACVPNITERYLEPVFREILAQFPFVIQNFHSDNGSEFINKVAAELLEKLRIQQTKSRPRHSTDNGLVETKNGAIVRKHLGYRHIQRHHAPTIHAWYHDWLNVYVNYHRPCAFPTTITDKKGKEKIIYKHTDYTTPYERLKALPNATQFLQPNMTFEQLDKLAYAQSDTDFATTMNTAKQTAFATLKPITI